MRLSSAPNGLPRQRIKKSKKLSFRTATRLLKKQTSWPVCLSPPHGLCLLSGRLVIKRYPNIFFLFMPFQWQKKIFVCLLPNKLEIYMRQNPLFHGAGYVPFKGCVRRPRKCGCVLVLCKKMVSCRLRLLFCFPFCKT